MAEKQIRLPKWNGEEYYPATTTDAVADKERRKALSDIISDLEQDIQIQSATSDSQYGDLKKDVDNNTNDIAILKGNGEGSVSKKVSDEIAKVVAGAPADLDTLKEIAEYIASDKTQAAEIVSAIDNLNNLRIIDLGTQKTELAVKDMTEYVASNNIRTPQVFKWEATDGSSTLAVSIARLRGYGWMQYLFSRGGIERRAVSQTGEEEKWESYGGILSKTTGDDDTKVMSQKAITDELNKKQNQLKHYYEGEASARMYYKKDTATGGNISIAHVLNDKQAGIYYAERDADGQVTHEDNIYLTETYGNDDGHIGISSVDNDEEGKIISSSSIIIKPTQIRINNNHVSLTFANNTAEMRSNKDNVDGLDSVMRLTKEQAWLMHYLPGLVDYYNPLTKETEQRQSGIGIVVEDNSIAFYSEVGNYTAPFTIRKDGKIRMSGVSNDLANFLTETNVSVANIKQRVYELGDFPTTKAAENKAAENEIYKNRDISIIHYTVNNATSHIILQDVNDGLTQQVLYYAGNTYIRHLGANLNASWRKTNPTNIKYNQDNHRIALMHMVNQYGEGDNNIDWVELPTASDSKDGLMTKEQVKSLAGKQDKITKYFETDSYAGVSFTKDSTTHSSVQVSPSQALMYYKQGNHIDRIVASETEHINITSSDENGSNVSQVLVRPDEINIRDGKGKGYLNIKGNYTTLSSSQTDTGLRSTVQANDDTLWLMHYPEVKEGVESGGIGIVIDDNKIAFYSELNGYISPLMITKAGEIFIPNVCNDLAAYIKSLEKRIANLEAQLGIINEAQE